MNRINTTIKGLLLKIAGDKYQELVILALAWKSTLGELLADRYKITKFENKILFIQASNHVWLQDFVLYRPSYLEKIKKETNIEIDNIIAYIGATKMSDIRK